MKALVIDRAGYRITHREMTDEGFLKVPGRVARTGIQQYLASELGLTDREPSDIINVYRPPEEVFNTDSLASYDNKDVTDDHPGDMVTADSFKSVSVGHAISGGRQEGDFVVVDLLIKDSKAIKAVQGGKVELSAGYSAEYEHSPGRTEDGQEFEFIQRDIRINHVALVDRARAGREARLYDEDPSGRKQMIKVTLDSSTHVELEDKSTATLIQNTIDGLRKRVSDMEEEKAKTDQEMEELKAKKEKAEEDAEEAKKESSDSAISERIKTIHQVTADAKKVAGDDFTTDSLLPLQIKREALAKVRKNVDWADKSDAYVEAAWDAQMEMSDEDRQKAAARGSHDGLSEDLRKRYYGEDGTKVGDAAYEKFLNGGE
jgi:hypothetical protein